MWLRIKSLIPPELRKRIRIALSLKRLHGVSVLTLFRVIKFTSLGEVLSCFEDFSGRPEGVTTIEIRGLSCPMLLRNQTSDFSVFQQVFIEEQYKIKGLKNVEYIVDAGANVGFTSVYLLLRFPNAKVVSIEPDPENFTVAKENIRSFGERCNLVHAALWSKNGKLELRRGTFRDGRHWATQTVVSSGDSQIEVDACTISGLCKQFSFPRIDLLKVDIEGAELQVFRDGDTRFLENTNCCAVECHGEECVNAFLSKVSQFNFRVSTQSELHVAIAE